MAACILLVCGLTVSAQVEHRVNQGNANTSGYALDRSNQVGSAGFNLSRPGMQPGSYSDALITRNVGGLAAFQGYSPIPQENSFRLNLPSASLADFERRSVSPAEIGVSGLNQQSFYYDQQRTIPTFEQIRNRQNLPGASQLASPNLPPIDPTAGRMRRFTPNVRDIADTRVGYNTRPAPITGMTQTMLAKPQPAKPIGDVAPAYRAAISSPLFGVNLPRPGAPEPGTFGEIPRGGADQVPASGAPGGLTPRAPTGQGLSRPDDPFAPKKFGQPLAEPAAGERPSPAGSIPGGPAGRPAERSPLPLDGRTPDNLGADRFADLYNAVRVAEQMGVRDLSFAAAPRAAKAAGQEGGALSDDAAAEEAPGPGLRRTSSKGVEELSVAAKWAGQLLEDPIKTFVGKYQDRLNECMAGGEEAMQTGQYYRAARLFDLAHTVDPMNPLPLVQRGHALLAAGDYVSALISLEQGIKLFPQIAAFKIDLPYLVGGKDVFDVRRADLESRLAGKDNYEDRFLLGYMELYSGLEAVGLKDIAAAGSAAPVGSAIRQFADSIVGRSPLPKLDQ